jgi:ribosomal protein L4
VEAAGINPLALAAYDKVLVTRGAVKMLEERLQ